MACRWYATAGFLMTTAVVPTIPLPVLLPAPVVLPHVALTPHDATTKAALRYLDAERTAANGSGPDHREHADAFDHLVAICFRWTKALRNKKTGKAEGQYFLRDRHGSLKVEKTEKASEQCFTYSDIDGSRTTYARKEGEAHDVTRQWIQEWLLDFLARYHGKPEHEISAAADAGKFRYLGLWCRLALKKAVYRQRKREAKEEFTGHQTATENIGTNEMGFPSPLRAHLPFDQISDGIYNAHRVVLANAAALRELDLLTGMLAYLSVAEHITEPHFEGRVTRAIAKMLGVSEKAARNYKQRYRKTVERELGARNTLLHSIIRELDDEHGAIIVEESHAPERKGNLQLLHESRQLMAEFTSDCRGEGLWESADDAATEEWRLAAEDRR
jgi:hypothetical protein